MRNVQMSRRLETTTKEKDDEEEEDQRCGED